MKIKHPQYEIRHEKMIFKHENVLAHIPKTPQRKNGSDKLVRLIPPAIQP